VRPAKGADVHHDHLCGDGPSRALTDYPLLVKANGLPEQATNPVAFDRPPHRARNPKTDPESKVRLWLWENEATHTSARKRPATAKDAGKSSVAAQGFPDRTIVRQWTWMRPARCVYSSWLTESFLRPLARRRLITLRPFFVAMRARNPCVLRLLRRCGWNVLFMLYSTVPFRLEKLNVRVFCPSYKAVFEQQDCR
jgi:hypothetical protein